LVTGSNGFIAKNLVEHLKIDKGMEELYLYDKGKSTNILEVSIYMESSK